MKKPLISVIIPAYNEAEVIKKTLLSLKNQKTKIPYEIIVCDNNSKDDTFKIAKKYANKVIKEKKQGSRFARNTATFKHSKGKYLVHTDADTIFPDNFIEEVYKIFKQKKYVGFICGNWKYDGNSFLFKLKALLGSILFYLYMQIQSMRKVVTLVGWCLCTPRWVFDKVGGFANAPNYFEDMYYSYLIDYLGDFKYFPNIKVTTSTRRFENGVRNGLAYYAKLNAKLSDFWHNITRKKYTKPFKIK
jgi:cellulose synthase/poly-beta-1,6-N-acetylglucosamine synthase-like glycosyltransferase